MKLKIVSARTQNQKTYIRKIVENDVILCSGNPGSGKSFCAIGYAICELVKGNTSKVVYCRPIVSAGRDIGALPGTAVEKLEPFAIPFFDTLAKFLDKRELDSYRKNNVIEICPIGLMRGRTIENGILICDEAQNCSKQELLAILTRIGEGSKIILTGDLNQSDLLDRDKIKVNGEYKLPFAICIDRLQDIPKVGIVTLTDVDVQRNKIIVEIEKALGEW